MDWNLFKDIKEAISATDEMIAKNRMTFPGIDPSLDEHAVVVPHLTSKFYYVHTDGANCMQCLRMVQSHACTH
jgi:hypothetical protein